jgi:Acetyltransferase (GNAT) domain
MEVLLNQLNKSAWNDFARKQPHSHFWHSWEWGEFLASFKHREILRFSVQDRDETILGLSSVCLEPLPVLRKWGYKKGDSIPVYHFAGPILANDLSERSRITVLDELIDFTTSELRKRAVLHFSTRIWNPVSALSSFEPWQKAGFIIREHRTLTYNVPRVVSEIEEKYTHSFRWAVKAGCRRGGIVEVNRSVDPAKIYKLYQISAAEGGICPRYSLPEVEHVLSWNTDLRDLYVCTYEEEPIGFTIALNFGKMSIYWLAGMDRKFRRINPMNLLVDQFIRNSVLKDLSIIDFGGGSGGLLHFKESTGAGPTPTFELTKTYCENRYLRLILKIALRVPGSKDLMQRYSTKLRIGL